MTMIIGIPKEIKADEYRVGMSPSAVRLLALKGHTVIVQRGAGEGTGFSDDDYSAEGAEVVDAPDELWKRSQMVVKVKEPIEAEYPFFREGLIIYAFLHLAADKTLTEALLNAKVTGIAFETIQEPDGSLPILVPMSEIAGRMSIQAGAKFLEKPQGGRGALLGGVPGTEKGQVAVLGGGVAGYNAARMALGLGANVRILDISLARLRQLDDIFGGAVETLHSNPHTVLKAVTIADLVVGSVLIPGALAPRLLTRQMLGHMKKGAVIVDISIDQGGCVETSRPTSHKEPVFSVDGVIHYCVTNMPGAVPQTSTIALSNASSGYALNIADKGLKKAVAESAPLSKGVNTHDGKLTCKRVADSLALNYDQLNL
jgi:alanine dehydrogenase